MENIPSAVVTRFLKPNIGPVGVVLASKRAHKSKKNLAHILKSEMGPTLHLLSLMRGDLSKVEEWIFEYLIVGWVPWPMWRLKYSGWFQTAKRNDDPIQNWSLISGKECASNMTYLWTTLHIWTCFGTQNRCVLMMQACVMFSVCPAVQIYARIISATIKAFFHILAFNIEMGFSFFVKAISTRDPDLVLDTPPPLATHHTYPAKQKSVLMSKCQNIYRNVSGFQ